MKKKIEYDDDLQLVLIQFMLSCPNAYVRCQNILKPEYWNDKLRPAIRYILQFSNEYRVLPTPEQVMAETKVHAPVVDGILPNHEEWFLNTVEDFCRHRAMENLIYEGPDLIATGDYSELERRTKENMLISLQTELGTDYFKNPQERLQKMRDKTDTTSTGWKDIDKFLFGGMNRGELTFWVGGPGCLIFSTKIRTIKLLDI